METEKMKRIEAARDEICLLRCHLESSASEIGDWKIVKIYEYRLQGKEDPYNFEELQATRQAARDRINELQAEIDALAIAAE